jgi:signal peptidase II
MQKMCPEFSGNGEIEELRMHYHLMAWPALIIVALDQITKLAVANNLKLYQSVPVVTGFFNLVHVRNRGIAFGLMNQHNTGFSFFFLVAVSLCAIALLLIWSLKLKENATLTGLGLSLILGGAVANLLDRIRLQGVIDFLDFYIGSYHWPAFNVADSAITVGTALVAISLFFHRASNE